ncbi:ankyrin repeat-containing domain protein [Mycena metata]|uniref:Ankyrin repeat-containing domain protein n=1 Tax=Mycena metata TaxID=1033252 RepID=A0AAD7DRL4_9AGAR|nr:ankyrin repeat-containing domain protein [Mycena metata]
MGLRLEAAHRQENACPPHSVRPSPETSWHWSPSALHVAAKAQNTEIALLLEAGANPAAKWGQIKYQPLYLAAANRELAMMKLLLDHGAPVDGVFGCDGASETALHYACSTGHVEMIELLLKHGTDIEAQGHYGTALGFAVHRRKLDAVRCLLGWGAEATVTAPLMIYLDNEGPPLPHTADLLYVALGLRHPSSPSWHASHPSDISNPPRAGTPAEWEGLPLGTEQKELMALLLFYGASKETTMETIHTHLMPLAKEALHSEEEFL